MKRWFIFLCLSFSAQTSFAMGDLPPFTQVQVDRLEWSDASNQHWDMEIWQGSALKKIGLKSEGRRTNNHFDGGEFQLLYRQATTAFWDWTIGWQRRLKPDVVDGLVVGLQGLAPYWLETELSFFISEGAELSARLMLDYELPLTKRWILIPETEWNAGKESTEMEVGLRLHYVIDREIMPYVGVEWARAWKPALEDRGQAVLGVRLWF